jgi:DNA-binding NtrC family response regulator
MLLDMAMPRLAGPATLRAGRAADPTLRVILMSGDASGDDARGLIAEGALDLLEKPFTSARLREVVAAALRDLEAGRGRRPLAS